MTDLPRRDRRMPRGTVHGIPAVPGVAYGPVLRVATGPPADPGARVDVESLTSTQALDRYDAAVTAVAARLEHRAATTSGSAAEVLTASAALVRDPGLRSAVRQHLEAGDGLLAAVRSGVDRFTDPLSRLGGQMAERVSDLRDLEGRLTAAIAGDPEPGVPVPDRPSVLVADDLAPADTAGLDPALTLAVLTRRGGPTSHTAIIARQLGIPCVVAVAEALALEDGSPVLVDGAAGTVEVAPDPETATARVCAHERHRRAAESWAGPGRTVDGTAVPLLANVADLASAVEAARGPAEGCGLFRTELGFLDRRAEPPVEEQARIYAEVLEAFGPGRPVVVRTLDTGADKPASFTSAARPPNPALGVRGLRLSSDDPGPLTRQLDAIALAAERSGTLPRVMAPLVTTAGEARAFAAEVHARGLRAGVMVEVPAAALLADRLLEHVDFLSVGTNDLAQYTMAADRTAAGLAHLTDPWQPAVLALVAMTAAAGTRAGKPVGVCGEAAADPDLAAVLVGMGVSSLSMAAAAIGPVGVRLAGVTMDTCRAAAAAALDAGDPAAGRDAVRALLSPAR